MIPIQPFRVVPVGKNQSSVFFDKNSQAGKCESAFIKRREPLTLKKYNSKENHNIFCETSQVVFEEFQAYNAQKLVAIGILHILFLSLPMF